MDHNNNSFNRSVHNSLVRLKWIKLTHDDTIELDNYRYKFDKIMDTLDKHGLGMSKDLEDLFFNAGLPDGSKYFRNVDCNRTRKRHSSEDDEAKSNDQTDESHKKQKHNNVEKVDFLEYHKANGHCSLEALKKQAKICDIELTEEVECENCTNHQLVIDVLKDQPEPLVESHAVLESIYAYLSPEFPCAGYTGHHKVKRFFIILDDYSRMMFIYTLRSENEIIQILFKFLQHCKRFKGTGVKKLITENKAEFVDPELEVFLRKEKIEHVKSDPGKRKPIIDYHVKSIQIMLKLLMADAEDINKTLWSEAVKCSVYIYNNLPNKYLNWKTPCDRWLDKNLKFSKKLYPFGSWFMAQMPQNNSSRSNFDSVRMVASRLVGYHPHDLELYKLYNPKDGILEEIQI